MTDILTPVGRLVYGNLYSPNKKTNRDGTPKFGKDGQQMQSFDYGIAIPKGAEGHWAETPWGAIIWAEGHTAFPRGEAQRNDFAWKVHDGDSTDLNKANKRLCDKEGYPGHWVLNFSSAYPSKYVNFDGSRVLMENERIETGYYIQIAGNITGNDSQESPGVYLNHNAISLQSVFERIIGGIDTTTVGFGQSEMPNGMARNTVPAAGMTQAPPAPPNVPQAPAPATPAPTGTVAQQPAPVASSATPAGNVAPIPNYGTAGAPPPPPPRQ